MERLLPLMSKPGVYKCNPTNFQEISRTHLINWPNLVLETWEISVTHNFQGYFSTTFQDLKLQFAGLSRTKGIFQVLEF